MDGFAYALFLCLMFYVYFILNTLQWLQLKSVSREIGGDEMCVSTFWVWKKRFRDTIKQTDSENLGFWSVCNRGLLGEKRKKFRHFLLFIIIFFTLCCERSGSHEQKREIHDQKYYSFGPNVWHLSWFFQQVDKMSFDFAILWKTTIPSKRTKAKQT